MLAVVLAAVLLVVGAIAWAHVGLGACGEATENPYCDATNSTLFFVVPGPAVLMLLGGWAAAEMRVRWLLAFSAVACAASIGTFVYLADHWST